MEIKHNASGQSGQFYMEKDGETVAEMVYEMQDNHTMTILHTAVDPSLEGQGVGLKLLSELIDYVRNEKIKVIPRCTFASAMLKRHKEWQDVLAEN